MYGLMERLYPICRSITGNGVRASLAMIQESIPITINEVATGSHVLDWTVPLEWNVRDAYVADATGRRVIDFQKHSLHLMSYSAPVNQTMTLDELRPHLYTLPDQPSVIPYRTSYYKRDWGFCLAQDDLDSLPEGNYDVFIDSAFSHGALTYGELLLPGESEEEVLLSVHCCHPSMCNDNLSGMTVATELARRLQQADTHYSYRFLFVPGTIGSITWLSQHRDHVHRIRHGLVMACLGDSGAFTYKQSRQGRAEIDRAVEVALRDSGRRFEVRAFTPYGYDERQYCSPGFDLAVGALSRTPYSEFAEYHTSADNLEFVQAEYLAESLNVYLDVLSVLEGNGRYRSSHPFGEPQLGRRGLYSDVGGRKKSNNEELAMLWVLNQSDGQHSLLDIVERSSLSFADISSASRALLEHDLLVKA
jgi:aminopeptidase-like protein